MVDLVDMEFFVRVIACGSLSAAGRELGFSPAVASKRLARMEEQLGVRLLQRSSRRLALTEEGARYVECCRQILAHVAEAEDSIAGNKHVVRGTLHISCPVALGRRLVGQALTAFARQWPELHVRLSLSDSLVDLLEAGFDCAIRIGGAEDSRLVARKLADNHRIICASPAYLASAAPLRVPEDLINHSAITLASQFTGFVEWPITQIASGQQKTLRVPVRMATDNGEQAHDWALAGLGLIRRSVWDVRDELANGTLVAVLPGWQSDPAPIRVVFPSRQFLPARTRLFIDFLVDFFAAANKAGMQNKHGC